MAKKEFKFRGLNLDQVMKLSDKEFTGLIPSKERRKLLYSITDAEKILITHIKENRKTLETHCRDMVIMPFMIGKTIKIHNGKEFFPVEIVPEMLGHRLGEFAQTRRRIEHSSPGVGATKSSASVSVR